MNIPSFRRVVPAVLILTLMCACRAQAEVSQNVVSFPVRLQLESGQRGSGLFVRTENSLFLVTAAHVLRKPGSTNLYSTSAKVRYLATTSARPVEDGFALDLSWYEKESHLHFSKTHDAAVIRLGKTEALGGTPPFSYKFLLFKVALNEAPRGGLATVPPETFKLFGSIPVSGSVLVAGFPESLGIPNETPLVASVPLLTGGIVSQKNEDKLLMVIDCSTFPGNSGGPVWYVAPNQATLHFAGIISQFVPFTDQARSERYGIPTSVDISNSGYSIVVPADPVLQLIEAAEREK